MKDNYEILGVSKDATRDEITKAYRIHLVKYRQLGSEATKEQKEEFDKIEKAYNELMGYNVKVNKTPIENQNPILKLLRIDQDKFENFWMYNKVKIIVGLCLLVFLFILTPQLFNRPVYDFNIVVTGDFSMIDEVGDEVAFNKENIENDVLEHFTEVSTPLVNYYYDSIYVNEIGTQVGLMSKQKFTATLFAGDIDFFILDENVFEEYANKGFLEDLSEFVSENNIEKSRQVVGTYRDKEGITTTSVYGIDITDTEFIKRNNIVVKNSERIIAAVCVNGDHKEVALKYLAYFIDI